MDPLPGRRRNGFGAAFGTGQSSWPGYPNNNTISVTSGGSVGVGTSSPWAVLNVVTNDSWTGIELDSFQSSGKFNGIIQMSARGTSTAPLATQSMDLLGFLRWNGWTGSGNASGAQITAYAAGPFTPSSSPGILTFSTTPAGSIGLPERMRIDSSGNVGIGTTNPTYRLTVEGTIGARDVIVTNAPWADYVFRSDYRLRPLSEVSTYVQQHHRLPDIPSEAEVKEKSVSVAEMHARLLAKVEELTLHMIEQEEQNRELRERLAALETRGSTTVASTPDRRGE